MEYSERDHTFVICAYQESPYLKECIESILKQNKLGKVLLSTSTPNAYIINLAEEYNIPLYVNEGEKGIAGDWNYAYSCVETKLLTIAHQDDIYEAHYLEEVLKGVNYSKHPLIVFTDYGELRKGKTVYKNSLLIIKRILLFPMRIKMNQSSVFIRRRALSIGSCICCPAVTYVKNNLPNPMFQPGFKSNIDWQAWEKISRLKGQFVYCTKPAMLHRIHEKSTTTVLINNAERTQEDYEMFCMFWPGWIAKIIMKFYQKGQKSNKV